MSVPVSYVYVYGLALDKGHTAAAPQAYPVAATIGSPGHVEMMLLKVEG